MKKVLFATTALIATAGMAAADVRISGYGRFGLDYNEANGTVAGVSETNLTSRLRLQFDMSAETDGGVTFGARVRLENEERDGLRNPAGGVATAARGMSLARFYVSAGGFSLGVGNIWGAIDSMPGLYLPTSSVGTGIDGMGYHSVVVTTSVDAFSSTGGGRQNAIEALYSAGAFSGHISYSSPNGVASSDRLAINVAYSFGDWKAAIGIQDSDTMGEDVTVLTLTGDLGVARVGLAYADNKDQNATAGDDVSKVRVYGAFDLGAATTLVAWVANEDNPNAASDGTSYGLNVSHDLGGGVTLDGGFVEHHDNNTQFQVGAYFRF